MGSLIIRKAEYDDWPQMLHIYNDEVVNGLSNLDVHPKKMDAWEDYCRRFNRDNHPMLVAESADGHIAGYASLGRYREKEAYASTVELSVYVAREDRKQGVATLLLEELQKEAREGPQTHLVISIITSVNRASIELHRKFGFLYSGRSHEVGQKFGHYLDIDYYELTV